MMRMSLPGGRCVHCHALVLEDIQCPGCGWIDPMTSIDMVDCPQCEGNTVLTLMSGDEITCPDCYGRGQTKHYLYPFYERQICEGSCHQFKDGSWTQRERA